MSAPPDISPAGLVRRLREGAGGDDAELRLALGLGPEAADRDLARTIVRTIAVAQLAAISVSPDKDHDARRAETPEMMTAIDASFLGQLASRTESDERPAVEQLEDVRTLLAIARAGALVQRRAAVRRLGARVGEGDLSAEELRAVTTTLVNLRDVEIAYELAHARETLPGAQGRQARQETDEFARILEPLERAIDEFWAGQSSVEPVSALVPDERAQLMMRLRDAPDVVLAHLGSVLDGSDGVSSREKRLALLSSVRYSGDPRLSSSLVGLIATRTAEFVSEAARALARMDDPRTHPALAGAYERSVVDSERAILAGALGIVGDVRGRDYVRKLLSSDDPRVLLAAVVAMQSLSTSEEYRKLSALLERPDPVQLSHVVRSIGHTGDPRGLAALAELRDAAGMSPLWGDVEDAEAVIRAQMELRGEEPPEPTESVALATASRRGMAERKRDPMVVRFRSWFDLMMGHVWLALGLQRRAVARFERAAGRRSGWAVPLTAVALHHARHERHAQALAAFRRALEADRSWIERQAFIVRPLARIFLRRAEEVERSGRVDIARGLVEEVLALDLRRLPSELRFELTRRREHLRQRSAT